jgi:metallo-beta-lactamase family protein
MLYLLADLHRKKRLPAMKIYVDSPLAMKATEITLRHMAILDPDTSEVMNWARKQGRGMQIHFIQDVEESMQLHEIKHGAIIISASGMCDAGRIKHHLRHNLGRKESTILITGFQAAGTLGRRIVDGAKEVRIFGVPVPVRAAIYTIGGLSAHADQAGLLGWLSHFKRAPAQTFIVHGEAETTQIFASVVRDKLHWNGVTAPALNRVVTL